MEFANVAEPGFRAHPFMIRHFEPCNKADICTCSAQSGSADDIVNIASEEKHVFKPSTGQKHVFKPTTGQQAFISLTQVLKAIQMARERHGHQVSLQDILECVQQLVPGHTTEHIDFLVGKVVDKGYAQRSGNTVWLT